MTTRQAHPQPETTSTSNVRRNLFGHHLTRRPASSSTIKSMPNSQAPENEEVEAEDNEILVRPKEGVYQWTFPVVPMGERELEAQREEARKDKESKCADAQRS